MAYPYPKPYPAASDVWMKRPSFLFVTKKILVTEGYRGFFRGLGPCLLRSFPVNASALFVYESLLRAFGAEKVRSRHGSPSVFSLTLMFRQGNSRGAHQYFETSRIFGISGNSHAVRDLYSQLNQSSDYIPSHALRIVFGAFTENDPVQR